MKKIITLFLTFFFALNLSAQEKPVKIVFDVTSSDAKVHQAAIRHVKFMSQAYADAQFEVVMYSGSIDMVLKEKSSVAEDLEALAKKDNITDDQLIPGLVQVPDGILEIIMKQAEGWGYIKEGR